MIDYLTLIALIGFVIVISVLFGRYQNKQKLKKLISTLISQGVAVHENRIVLDDLPPPVKRYLKKVLPTDGQLINKVKLQQNGLIRTNIDSKNWLTFTAEQLIAPLAKGFVWHASIKPPRLPKALQIEVLDSYINGKGSGAVNFMTAFTVAKAADVPELNSGALHRYLAEAVWYPSALLPQHGVVWHAKDDRSAVATISDHGTSVSLEFRFNQHDEVVAIYTPARFGRFGGEYKQVAWEGHFSNYQCQQGFWLPRNGEVGWYDGGELQLVWQGEINKFEIETL